MIEQIATVKETYAFGFIKEKQKKVTEESGTISMALAKNIASRKVPQLFTSVEEVYKAREAKDYLNRRKAIHFGGRDKEIYKRTSSFAIVKSEGRPTDNIVIRKKYAILP